MSEKITILFLCTGNSCRSQMAEGWARFLKSDELEPFSAGTEKHGLNKFAVKVMAEAGVDISGHTSKLITDLLEKDFDYVVTVCDDARESCPLFQSKSRVMHHGFADPPKLAEGAATEEEALQYYRQVRDQIRGFVESLPDSLTDQTI